MVLPDPEQPLEKDARDCNAGPLDTLEDLALKNGQFVLESRDQFAEELQLLLGELLNVGMGGFPVRLIFKAFADPP